MAEIIDPRIAEAPLLTWAQICERYPDEWVVVVDMVWPERHYELESARVVSHDPHRRPALQGARGIIGRRPTGSFFTGAIHGPAPGTWWW